MKTVMVVMGLLMVSSAFGARYDLKATARAFTRWEVDACAVAKERAVADLEGQCAELGEAARVRSYLLPQPIRCVIPEYGSGALRACTRICFATCEVER